MGSLHELGFEDCVCMLRAAVVGRAALMTPHGPHIVPLNYTVADGAILVATAPYSALGTYGPGAIVAFEVDQFDLDERTGWSVVVRGRAAAVARPTAASSPWVDGSRNLCLRIPWTEVSGRRVGAQPVDSDQVGLRRPVGWSQARSCR